MIEQQPKTRENILRIAAEYGIGEQSFIYLLKQKKLIGPFDPDKWNIYIELISHFPPCPLCGGDQKCYIRLAGSFKSPRGLGCRENKSHFFIYHIGVEQIKRLHPEFSHEEAVKYAIGTWKEVVLDAHGDSRYREECVEISGKYYPKPEASASTTSFGGDNSII